MFTNTFVYILLKNIFDSVGFSFAFIPCKRTRQTSNFFAVRNAYTETAKERSISISIYDNTNCFIQDKTHLVAATFITFASKNVDAVAVVDPLSDLWDLTAKGKDTITVSIISSELRT